MNTADSTAPYGPATRTGPRRADPNREVRDTADFALEHVTVPHKSSATSSNRYINGRSAYSAGTDDQAPEPANSRRSVRPRAGGSTIAGLHHGLRQARGPSGRLRGRR